MSNPNDYTVGWICAITTEYVAAQAVLDEKHEGPEIFSTNDNNDYTLGKIGKHNVVIAVLPDGEYGISSATRVAADMSHSFPNVRIGLMVGVGGGAPSRKHDIRLGDVVVSSPGGGNGGVFQYDFGKTIQGQSFRTTGFLNQPPSVLRAAVTGLKAQYEGEGNQLEAAISAILNKKPRLRKKYQRPDPSSDRLYQSDVHHPINEESNCAVVCGDNPSALILRPERTEYEDNPTIHYGLIASANQLMKDAVLRDTLAAEKDVMCFEMEAAGLMNHFPCLVIRGICDYSDSHKNKEWQGYAAIVAAVYTRDLLNRIAPNRVKAEKKISSLLIKIDQKMDTISQNISFDRLPIAEGAVFDSQAEEMNPICLEDTRVDLLHQISKWADDPHAKAIFWLNGMAGTGKSTISRTIAHSFATSGHLGASFFFKRGGTDRGNLSKFITTVAADLVVRQPTVAPYIKSAINADSTITRKGVKEQFDKLILQPLSAASLNAGKPGSIVIVIDALDECEPEDKVKLIIHIFGHAKSLGLRIFATSRPELPIRLGFSTIQGEYQNVILHEIPEPVIKHDLSVFLKHELATIRENYNKTVPEDRQLDEYWPSQSSVNALVMMAIPLFVFATTVCRFLADRKCGNPDDQLRKVLNYQTKSQESKLNATYLPVLDQQISGLCQQQKDEVLQEFRDIVGPIIILANPLSTSALTQILNIPKHTIDNRLDMLHSVLGIPLSAESPVRLLHLSFRNFLVDSEKREKSPFWIDENHTHESMAANCLRILDSLKQDLCGIKAPSTPRSTISPQKISACLPPEVQYACLYWVYHIREAGIHITDGEPVHNFLTCHFLHWMEALSLLGRALESLSLIKTLQILLKPRSSKQLSDFLDDATRFIRTNISTIGLVPLQIYSSVLAFAPEKSKVRTTFQGEIARWISPQPKVESDWSQCLQTLEGHRDRVLSVTISHDSALVASGSQDKTVRIWRADSGECIQTLISHNEGVNSVVFSHDSALVASGSSDMTIRIWRADSGECVRILNGHNDRVHSVAFSHDSTLVASASEDQTIWIWRADTGECVQTLKGHGLEVWSVAFSHDSTLVSLASDYGLQVWHTNTGKCVQILEGHGREVWSVAFSHDSTLVASASDDRIHVWRADTGECVQVLEGYGGLVWSVAFSHDLLVASASNDKTIQIWRTDTGECVQVLEGCSGLVNSVAFSHDSALVATAADDKTIQIWRANTGEFVQTLEGHSDRVNSVVVSPNLALVATASDDMMIRIWRADTGECVQTLEGHSDGVRSIAFSHDSALIASASYDKTIRTWRANTGECVQALKDHGSDVYSVAFSHDSALVASASADKTIRIWRTDTGECVQVLEGHSGSVWSVVFLHKSMLVASASADKTIRIWRANTGECVQTLEGHSDRVNSVALSHDLALMATASGDKTIRIWRVDKGECIYKIDIGAVSNNLSFDLETGHLLTDIGVIAIHKMASTFPATESFAKAIPSHRSGCGISRDGCWVTWNDDSLLWLPVEARPSCSAILGSTVVIGCNSGKVIIVGLSSHELPNLY